MTRLVFISAEIFCFNVSKIAEDEHLLSVWSVDNSLNVTHIKDVSIGDYDRYAYNSLQLDEHYIAVHAPNEDASTTFTFISQKTFQVERHVRSHFP